MRKDHKTTGEVIGIGDHRGDIVAAREDAIPEFEQTGRTWYVADQISTETFGNSIVAWLETSDRATGLLLGPGWRIIRKDRSGESA